MKKKDKIILAIILIVALLGAWATNAQNIVFKEIATDSTIKQVGKSWVVSNNPNVRIIYNDYIIQSKEKYSTLYMITYNGTSYYCDMFYTIKNEFLFFSEYNRNGTLRNSYRFPFNKCKIYKSKEN